MNKELLKEKNQKQITLIMDKDLFLKLKLRSVKDEKTITKIINDLVVSDLKE